MGKFCGACGPTDAAEDPHHQLRAALRNRAMMKLWHCLINGQFRSDKKKKKKKRRQSPNCRNIFCSLWIQNSFFFLIDKLCLTKYGSHK